MSDFKLGQVQIGKIALWINSIVVTTAGITIIATQATVAGLVTTLNNLLATPLGAFGVTIGGISGVVGLIQLFMMMRK